MARYTDEYRASAILLLEAAGYPDTKGALAQVARRLSVPARTLSRWYRGERNPPPVQVVNEKTFDLETAIKSEIEAIFKSLNKEREDASYKELGTVLGILLDKVIALKSLQHGSSERLTITFERAGISTVPEHLISFAERGGGLLPPVQRS